MLITEKIKIRPNKELRRRLHQLVDGRRFIYNYMVNLVNHDKLSSISARDTYRRLLKENQILNKNGDVIAAILDHVYDEITKGNGYEVYQIMYSVLKGNDKPTFNTLGYSSKDAEWLEVGDEVTHWMYMPSPPER